MQFTTEDATNLLIKWLREPPSRDVTRYGYDIYLPNLVRQYLQRQGVDQFQQDDKLRELMPAFFAAGWDLCCRGILRPGIRNVGLQATDEGNAEAGYSITPFGEQWLREANKDDYVPTEPGRFAELLQQFEPLFSQGFQERAQEAIRCYGAHAYLATCAMCGAAAESILLTIAIAKTKDRAAVHKEYGTSSGRRKVENLAFRKARQQLQDDYRNYASLLKYWRDSSSHGRAIGMSDNEAYTTLLLLLRFSMFASDNWSELTS